MPRRKKEETALAKWDEELAELIGDTEKQVDHLGGGKFFSLAGAQLSLGGAPIPNNEVAVVVAYSVLENVYYEGRYDPDNPGSPLCYAFSPTEEGMAPHDDCADPQNETCTGCPLNEWASAETGRGKACRNRIRLALIPAGVLDEGTFEPADSLNAGELAFLNLSPTMLGSYGKYVKELKARLELPVQRVYTKIKVSPHSKNQVQISFEPLGELPAKLGGQLVESVRMAKELIATPYPKREEEQEKKPAKRRGRPRKKKF